MSVRLSTALPVRLLGRHVGGRAEDHPRLRHRRRRDRRRHRRVLRRRARSAGSSAFARPKSSTFTVPSARTLMFAGLRSRWMMPCSCAASSASAICFAIGSASSIGIGAARDAVARASPSTSSITSARDAAGFFEAVDVRDVRMIQRREDFALRAGSARADRRSAANGRGQHLDRDVALQLRVASRDRPRPCRRRRCGR